MTEYDLHEEIFHFYLDAWIFCSRSEFPLTRIYRKDWRTWAVNTD